PLGGHGRSGSVCRGLETFRNHRAFRTSRGHSLDRGPDPSQKSGRAAEGHRAHQGTRGDTGEEKTYGGPFDRKSMSLCTCPTTPSESFPIWVAIRPKEKK